MDKESSANRGETDPTQVPSGERSSSGPPEWPWPGPQGDRC